MCGKRKLLVLCAQPERKKGLITRVFWKSRVTLSLHLLHRRDCTSGWEFPLDHHLFLQSLGYKMKYACLPGSTTLFTLKHLKTIWMTCEDSRSTKRATELNLHWKNVSSSKTRFLGRVVTRDGHTMDPADIAPVQAVKQRNPSTIEEVRKLLGIMSYYLTMAQTFHA